MGFDGLLGNERLKQTLGASIQRGHISHFYLISGPEGAGKHTLATLLAAAIHCRGQEKPCLTCPACRKVLANAHPDFITIDDPEKKTVPVDLIRQARADIFVQPNEADRKIYLFPRAQDMGVPGQNALLKILEEPPAYGVFLLLTDNPESLLPTVRSRCTLLTLNSLPDALLRRQLRQDFPEASEDTITAAIARSGGYLGQAKQLLEAGCAVTPQTDAFVRSYCNKDALLLLQTLIPMERWKRDQLIPVLKEWAELFHSALIYRSGSPVLLPMARQLGAARSSSELLEAVGHLQKAILYAQGNVSVAAVCGYLVWALR